MRKHPHAAPAGFTLIEVLIALTIVALVAAVALPGLARRLDTAFSDADLQQTVASARALPARTTTLGIDLTLDATALTRPLPDGALPLDLPAGWSAKVERPARLWHSGTCEPGSLVVQEPADGRRWRVAIARLTCEIEVSALAEGAP
ncbi:MAG: type II secretion system protein [Burkholderiales bacterium]|nr:type II secretion system protein [Burkholderiales bacterium]